MQKPSHWTRRTFLAGLSTTGIVAWPARRLVRSLPNETNYALADWEKPVPKTFSDPAWLDRGLVLVANHEPLVFQIRRGGQFYGGDLPVNVEALYRQEHTEETLLRLKRAGVNVIETHFYKTGLKSDREDIEVTKEFVPLCRKHGFKIGLYFGGSIFAETLIRDVPEAKDWVSYNEYAIPTRYDHEPYRYLPDFNHPGYVEYMKSVLRIAIQEIKPDFIDFDNMVLPAPPETGNTPEINRRFREFLQGKYTSEQQKERFGFSDVSAITVPSWHGMDDPSWMSPIGDPVIQEWIDFRCQDFADYYGKIADYIRRLDPNVAVELNCHGIFGVNRAFLNGVDHVRLVNHGSVFVSEESNEAQVTSDGILISKIRSLKLARSLNVTLFIRTGQQLADPELRSYRLEMAESMAYNKNCLGMIADPANPSVTILTATFPDDLVRYVRFYHDQNQHYRATRTVADVAVLRSFPSMAYNNLDPELHMTLMEQLLIQYKIPFHYVFDQNLGDLSKYHVLILAGQESLSDEAIEQITDFVRRGSNLVATGQTSLYNGWRRLRKDYGLAEVLGIHVGEQEPPVSKQGMFGVGRTAYVRDVIPSVSVPHWQPQGGFIRADFGQKFWKLPANSKELMSALRYAEGRPFPFEFENAPLTTVAELTEKDDGSERILHWLNYQLRSRVPATAVSVAIPAGRGVRSVGLISPDRSTEKLDFTLANGRVDFKMPELEVYNVAVISLV